MTVIQGSRMMRSWNLGKGTACAAILAMFVHLAGDGFESSAHAQDRPKDHSASQGNGEEVVDITDVPKPDGEAGYLAFAPRPGRFLMKVKRGWSGMFLFSGKYDGTEWTINETTAVGARNIKSEDGTNVTEIFPNRDPVMEAVSFDDGCKFLAARKGTALIRYRGVREGETVFKDCELRVEVLADTSEIDAAIKEAIPGANVKVIEVRSAALLSGTVPTDDDIGLLTKIGQQFYPDVIVQLKVDQSSKTEATRDSPAPRRIETKSLSGRAETIGNQDAVSPVVKGQPPRVQSDIAELRALRAEVRALHDDVRRLTGLLQKPATRSRDDSSSAATQDLSPTRLAPRPLANLELAALDKTVTASFQDLPLNEGLRHIGHDIGVNFALDPLGFEEVGVKPTAPLTIEFSGISARSALKLILEPFDLTVVAEDDVLKVTSRQRAKGELTVVAYPLRELLQSLPEALDQSSEDASKTIQQLVEVIQGTIKPDTWDQMGGPGSLRVFNQTQQLVVRQTADVHAEIVRLLEDVRSSRRLPAPKSSTRLDQKADRSIKNLSQSVIRTYSVADLVIPIPDATGPQRSPQAADWFRLIDGITTQVDPGVWTTSDGPASIQVHETTLSLVISAPQSTHERIARLLDRERRKQDVNIQFEVKFLQTRDANWLKEPEFEITFDPNTDAVLLSPAQAADVLKGAVDVGASILPGPKVTAIDGKMVTVQPEGDRKTRFPTIYLRGLSNAHDNSTKLSIAIQPKSLIQELTRRTISVNDGQSLLIDVTEPTRRDDLNLGANGHRLYLLIQPKVVVNAEASDPPARKQQK